MKDLTQDEWREAMALLDHVMDLEPEEQRAVLSASTAPTKIRAAVTRLLSHEEGDGDVLDRGAFDLIAPIVETDDQFDETAVRALETLSTGGDGLRLRPNELEAGTMVGPYRIDRLIGRGGMGEVYLAERDDDAYTQKVALKLVRVQGGGEVEARFRRERQILAVLRHQHIARLLDGGMTEQNRPYLVMEYVDGPTITAYANANGLDVDQRLTLFEQACRAVRYAHRRAIIHRDLKPSNLVVEERAAGSDSPTGAVRPVVKLLDFGIAKLLEPGEEEEPLTRAGERLMTPEYAAPEQVAGEPVTTSTDVYQLGVLMYELLTGQRPFYEVTEGKTGRARVRAAEDAILQQDPERPSQVLTRNAETLQRTHGTDPKRLAGRVRGDLDAIARKALRKDPAGRYGAVDELLDDLERYRDGRPVEARRGTWTYRTRKFLRRNRTAVSAGAIAAVLLMAFVVSLAVQTKRLGTALTEARTEAQQREEVQELFTSILNVAEPSPEYSDTLTVRDMLDRTARQAYEKFGSSPRLKAWTYQRLATYERDLGEFDRAIAFGDTAITIYDSLYTRETDDRAAFADEYADALARTAGVYATIDRKDRAFELRERAVTVIEQRRGTSSETLPLIAWFRRSDSSLDHLLAKIDIRESYLVSLRNSDSEKAAAEAARINALVERVWKMEETTRVPELSGEYLGLASYYQERGHYAVADSLYHLSLTLTKQRFGTRSMASLGVMNAVAYFEYIKGNYGKYLDMTREVVDVSRGIYGEGHPNLIDSLEDVVRALAKLGRSEEAIQPCKEALNISIAEYGPDHWQTVALQLRLANIYNAADRSDEAIPILRDVLQSRQERYGEGSIDVANVRINLAAALRRAGRPEDALREEERVLRVVRARYPEEVSQDTVRTSEFRRITRPYVAALQSRWLTLEDLGREEAVCQVLAEYDRIYNESPIGRLVYGEETAREITAAIANCDRRSL